MAQPRGSGQQYPKPGPGESLAIKPSSGAAADQTTSLINTFSIEQIRRHIDSLAKPTSELRASVVVVSGGAASGGGGIAGGLRRPPLAASLAPADHLPAHGGGTLATTDPPLTHHLPTPRP